MKYTSFSQGGYHYAQLIDHDLCAVGETPQDALDILIEGIVAAQEEGILSSIPPSPISHGFVRSRTLQVPSPS